MTNFLPTKRSDSRVFIIEGGARGDNTPDYQAGAMADSPERSYGDVTPIQVPSPTNYGDFDDVGEIQGERERPTVSIASRLPLDTKSLFLLLAERRCPFDIQIHFGQCSLPNSFNEFQKSLIIEGARITNWGTDQIGALESGDEEKVNETIDTSGAEIYEVVSQNWAEVGGDAVHNPLLDVIISSSVACGDCDEEDSGCDRIYATGASSPGSPGTAPDVVYSLDAGATWLAADINTLSESDSGNAIASINQYIAVISSTQDGINWILRSGLGLTPPVAGFSQTTTGFVNPNFPKDMWSTGNFAFIVGVGGYIYGTNNPASGVVVLDAGVATNDELECVHALSEDMALAGGANGALVGTRNQVTWSPFSAPTGLTDTITAVWVKAEREWWIGTDAGELYYTLNGGTDWALKALPGVAPSAVTDIAFGSNSIMYVSATVGGVGVIYRSYSGGNSFNIQPDSGGTFPTNQGIAAISACVNDRDFTAIAGDKDGSDGIIILGQA